ncbi:hypothetical protein LUZ60_013600 [Juncus effusus]|nr:hypothetical protein LUZ60_013600 [Juncus effusus]
MGMEIPVSDISVTIPQAEEEKQTLIPEKETVTAPEPVSPIPEKEGSKTESGEQNSANLAHKNAAVEWHERKVHDFYFPRSRPIDDPKIKAKIDQLTRTMNANKDSKSKIFNELSVKNKERSEIVGALLPLREKLKKLNETINQKKTEMAPVKEGLAKIRTDNFAIKEKGHGLCSSIEELDDLLRSLEYRMNHETMKLDEEKKLMKDIKQLEGTRARVIATAAERSKLDLNPKKGALEDQRKLISADMDEMKKERDAIWAQIKPLEEQKAPIDLAIKALEEQKNTLTERNNVAYKSLNETYDQQNALNAWFIEFRKMFNHAKILASQKNVASVEALYESEIEKFMNEWNTNKAFQEDYKKRILISLDQRHFTIDGRMRNPNEKPILQAQPATPKPAESAPAPDPVPAPTPAPVSKPVTTKKEKTKPVREEEEEEFFVRGKNESEKKEAVVDVKKMKEMKREEEILKNKMALERKKKLAEKNAVKAAAKAQKEAEEKLKKKEAKKAKKKGDASSPSDELAEAEPEPVEPDTDPKDELFDSAPAPQAKSRNLTFKSKKNKGQNSNVQHPKVILKRKKSVVKNYMAWAPVLMVALLAVLAGGFGAYYYKFYAKA